MMNKVRKSDWILQKSERINQLRGTIKLVWQPSRARTRWSEQSTGVPPCVPIAWDFAIIQAVNHRFRPRWDVLIFLSFQSGRLSRPDQDPGRTWARERAMRSPRTCHLTRTPGKRTIKAPDGARAFYTVHCKLSPLSCRAYLPTHFNDLHQGYKAWSTRPNHRRCTPYAYVDARCALL